MTNANRSRRIGNDERAAAEQALATHMRAGRLGIEEYSDLSAKAAAAGTVGELADLFADLPKPHPRLPGSPAWQRPAVLVAGAAVLVVVVVVIALVSGGSRSSTTPPVAMTIAPTTSSVALATTPDSALSTALSTAPTNASGTTDTAGVTPTPGPGDPAYLADVDAVDHGEYGNRYAKAMNVNGKFFGHSLVFYNECYNHDGGRVWAEYNLGRAYRTFTTTVGISDDDPGSAVGTYRVLLDGNVVTSGSIASGKPTPVTLSVNGALHIRLEVVNPVTATDSCSSNSEVHDVWGDAQIA